MINRSIILQNLARLDWWLVLNIVLLAVMGVLFIYSACYRGEDEPVEPFYKKQMLWILLGGLLFAATIAFDYHRLSTTAWPLYLVGVALLILVLLIPDDRNSAQRWLKFYGIRVQPSEIAKIFTILVLARFLSRPDNNLHQWRTIIIAMLVTAVPVFLIIREPDLGTAAILIPILIVMLFVAGIPLKKLGILLLIGVLLMPAGWFFLGGYQKDRIKVYFNVKSAQEEAGWKDKVWNKTQSEIAVGSGGLTGKGFLQGTQNVLGFLPRDVAPNDFIYSVIAEEMGFIGSCLVLILYATLLFFIMRAALLARDALGRYIAAGVAGLLFGHVFVNIAMTIGLMPITGLPLPLISYGGSFMLSTMLGLGLVQSIYVRRYVRG